MASKNYIFYKICSDDCDETYVGSTVNFKSRKNDHKNRCYNENSDKYNIKIYQAIRANGGWDNFKMIQIGTRDNITKREAEQVEEEYRLDLKATMNERRAFLSPEVHKEHKKEYRENNKEHTKEYDREYYQNNKEYIKEYREKNKEHIKEYIKEYRENNKEKLKEYDKEYKQNNKEKIKEKMKEKHDCKCGGKFTLTHKSRHERTKKHCEYIKNTIT